MSDPLALPAAALQAGGALVDDATPEKPAWSRRRLPAPGDPPIRFTSGPLTGFADVAGATIDEAWYVNNSNAAMAALGEAARRQRKRVYAATGEDLPDPVGDPTGLLSLFDRLLPARPDNPLWMATHDALDSQRMAVASFNAHVADLRAKFPDKDLPAGTLEEDAVSVGREAAADAAAIRARARGFWVREAGALAGGVAGGLSDPLQVGALPVGFGARTIVGAALKEAAVNAGIAGALDLVPGHAEWLDALGVRHSAADILRDVGSAAVLGGVLGGVGKAGQQALGRMFFDRTAFEVIQKKAEALPADHPLNRPEVRRAREVLQREADADDMRPDHVSPSDHAAALTQADRHADNPDLFEPPGGFLEPKRAELIDALDRGAGAEDIWNTQIARESDAANAGAPTHRAGDPLPEDRVYHLPDPEADGGVREADLPEAIDWLTEQAQRKAGPEGPAQQRRAIVVMGYPGAGKSTFIDRFAERTRAAVPDADLAKTIVPEYAGGSGAQVVHAESTALREEVMTRLTANGDNFLLETIGQNPDALLETVEELKRIGYNVELAHVRVPPDEAVRRAWRRYLATGRVITPTAARAMHGKVEASWDRLVESGAFSRYIDIDVSGPPHAAKTLASFPETDDGLAGRGPGRADLAGEAAEGAAPAAAPANADTYDLADEVRLIARDARAADEAPPPSTPGAPIDSRLADTAVGRAGDNPTAENLLAAAEEIEAELGDDAGDIVFSRGEAAGAPASADDLRTAAVAAFGEGADRIFTIVDQAPEKAPADAKAFTRKGNGQVSLIAGRVAADEVKGLLLHEIGAHTKIEEMIGRDDHLRLLQTVMDRARAGKGAWAGVWDKATESGEIGFAKAEEALGYFLEANPDLAPKEDWWARFAAGVRRWAAKIFGPRALSDADIVDLARFSIERRIAEGPRGPWSRDMGFTADLGDGEQVYFPQSDRTVFSRGQQAQPPQGFAAPKASAFGKTQPQGPVTPEFAVQRWRDALNRKAQRSLKSQWAAFRNGSGERDAGEFLQAILDYHGQGESLKLSVEGERRTIAARSMGRINATLEHFRTGVGGRRVNKADIENFVKEMFGEDSKDVAAKTLANGVRAELETLRQRFNRAGGQIGQLDNWGLPQHHDPLAIRKWIDANGGRVQGRKNFKTLLYDMLDVSRMRDVNTGQPLSAKEVWDSLDAVIANMITDGWASRTPQRIAQGATSLANSHADARFLVFRDPETWLAYQRDFGAGDPITGLARHIETMARDIAAMEILGPNPEAALTELKQMAEKEAANARLGLAAALPKRVVKRKDAGEAYVAGKIGRADQMWANYTGAVNAPVDEGVAAAGQATRNTLTALALGGAFLSAVPTDPVFQAMARSFAGLGRVRVIKDLARQTANPHEAAQLGLILEHNLSSFNDDARFVGQATGGGWSRVLSSQVLAASGLTPWTRGGRQLFGMGFLADAGNRAHLSFDQLEKPFARTLTRYGLRPADWDRLRGASLNPQGLLTPEAVEAHAGVEMADRYLHMILQEMEYAVPSGSLRSRSLLTGNDRPGTFWGEVRRSNKMFLSFSAMLPMLYGYRQVQQFRRGNWGAGAGYAAALLVTATVGGAVSLQLKAVRDGKDPQDMSDPRFWLAAMAQGGGLGIFGDYLYNGLNRANHSPAETLAGPVVAKVNDLQKLTLGNVNEALQGKETHAAAEWADELAKDVPGSSLWYVKLAYNRWVTDNLKRMTDPDAEASFRRKIGDLKRQTGQRYWWVPGRNLPERAPDAGAAAGQ
jgi:hypothetical protein